MKVFLKRDTFAPSLDGPALLEANTVADLDPDAARAAVVAGKALFVDPADDRTTRGTAPGGYTATAAQLEMAGYKPAAPAAAAKKAKA